MMGNKGLQQQVRKEDVPLYLDVHCYTCKKRMALSNAHQQDGRYFCSEHLIEKVVEEEKIIIE